MTRDELFKLAFGGSSPVFLTVPIGKEKEEKQPLYNGIKLKKDELAEYTAGDKKIYSDFGTEVIFPTYFKGGWYRSREWLPNMKFPEGWVQMDEFRLPNATMIDFSRGKNITTTQMPFGLGTVKEIFGFDDWRIRIRMICLSERNRSLTGQQIANILVKWAGLQGGIDVYGRLFFNKDIKSIFIDNIDIKSIEGSPNTVGLELSCSSDKPFELVYEDENNKIII